MARALVTGATSYLGVKLIERLGAEGWAAGAVVRPGSDTARLAALTVPPESLVFDGDTEKLAAAFTAFGADVVFHIAGYYVANHKPDDVARLVDANVTFGACVLDAMQRAGVPALVNLGSYTQHGEAGDGVPLNLYAATKQAFAEVLAYTAAVTPLKALTLTLYHSFGAGDWRPKLMGAIRDAQRDGSVLPLVAEDETTLDLVYVDDVVDALLRAADMLATDPDTVNGAEFALSSGRQVGISELIDIFAAVGGRDIKVDRGAYPPAARAIARPWSGPALPGWSAKTSLEEGIRRFIAAKEPAA